MTNTGKGGVSEDKRNILVRFWTIWEEFIGMLLSPLFASSADKKPVRSQTVPKGKVALFFQKRKFLLLSSLTIIILLPLAFLAYTYSGEVDAAWYDSSYRLRQVIYFENDGSAVTSPRQILIEIDTATLISAGKMQSDCDDVRFVFDGKAVPSSIDAHQGACNTASTDFYVEIDHVNSGGNKLWIYYGNPSATAGDEFEHTTHAGDIIAWWTLDETSGSRSDSHGTATLSDNNTVGYATGKQSNAASFVEANTEYLSRHFHRRDGD